MIGKRVNRYFISILYPLYMPTPKTSKLPIYKKIGLTRKEYKDWNIIKEHEKDFVARFTRLGYRIKWIKSAKRIKGRKRKPTNDFIWRGEEWELKTPKNPKYCFISDLINKGTKQGKKNFIIDIKEKYFKQQLKHQLSLFNQRTKGPKLDKLLVFHKNGISKVTMK